MNISQGIIKKSLITVSFVALIFLVGVSMVRVVHSATTNVDVTISAGALNLAASSSSTLSGLPVSTSAATSTGSIANVSVTDERGSGAGWSAVMTSQHFTSTSTVKQLDGTASSTVDFTGIYDGLDGVLDPNGTFIVEITTGGAVDTALFKWTDPAGNQLTGSTTASTIALSNGISATFAVGNYSVGQKWSAGVDMFPYTGFQVTPSTITAASGTTTNMTAGTAEYLTGSGVTSDSKTLMTAAVNFGFGDYDQASSLDLQVHANSLSGTFKADATITVS